MRNDFLKSVAVIMDSDLIPYEKSSIQSLLEQPEG